MLDVTREVIEYIGAETRTLGESEQVVKELNDWITNLQKIEQEKKEREAAEAKRKAVLDVKRQRAAAALADFYNDLFGDDDSLVFDADAFYEGLTRQEKDVKACVNNLKGFTCSKPKPTREKNIDAEVAAKLDKFLKQLGC